ncbi:Methyltransferase-like protein 4 [Portunus trituberculatus]|uniref:Methyltransferase-like protein 4 n=1 Tax=Portunus trituberculatus TaxID=210409 RepID=A0A5B7H0Q1_PORTR|nr:Methyltransferase-like protein 4 [Portunus trituberculatus]
MEASNVTLARLDGATGDGGFSTKVVCGAKYILPPHTRYICDDVANILSHTSGKRFDLVVMDPPWHNKHDHLTPKQFTTIIRLPQTPSYLKLSKEQQEEEIDNITMESPLSKSDCCGSL